MARTTNVKKHPRKTRKGRTTVKRHNRSLSRLKSLGYNEIAKLRESNDNKPYRLSEKKINDMDDKMPVIKKGDRPDPFFKDAKNLTAIESIILGKLVKEYDGDLHIYDLELSYEENLEIVLDEHPFRSDQKISDLYRSDRFHTKEWLEEIHKDRSTRSKAIDESRSNQVTLTIDEVLVLDESENIGKNLNKIDVEKIDTIRGE